MKTLLGWTLAAALMLPAAAQAGEAGDALVEHLYAGTASEGLEAATAGCEAQDYESCFAEGMIRLVGAYEGFARDLYRHGAVTPSSDTASLLFGMVPADEVVPGNPRPAPLTYEGLRTILEDFLVDLDHAGARFKAAGEGGDYVITIDPLRVRIDFGGNGEVTESETLATLIEAAGGLADMSLPAPPEPGKKTKGRPPVPNTTIGFDRADAVWFAGYLQVTAAPIDLVLAHDFSGFFEAYLHRIFPRADLPMQDYQRGPGFLFMAPDSDTEIADIIAAIHTIDFPVTDSERLAGVLNRLGAITNLSRRNWELILAETDDNRELVPSPRQTSLFPGVPVTQEVVDAWLKTLDTVDTILGGELLVPHWRFRQGFDLKAYFTTATESDLVMLLTGSAALPFLKDGPVADAQSFAEANRVFGTDWINYVFWFN